MSSDGAMDSGGFARRLVLVVWSAVFALIGLGSLSPAAAETADDLAPDVSTAEGPWVLPDEEERGWTQASTTPGGGVVVSELETIAPDLGPAPGSGVPPSEAGAGSPDPVTPLPDPVAPSPDPATPPPGGGGAQPPSLETDPPRSGEPPPPGAPVDPGPAPGPPQPDGPPPAVQPPDPEPATLNPIEPDRALSDPPTAAVVPRRPARSAITPVPPRGLPSIDFTVGPAPSLTRLIVRVSESPRPSVRSHPARVEVACGLEMASGSVPTASTATTIQFVAGPRCTVLVVDDGALDAHSAEVEVRLDGRRVRQQVPLQVQIDQRDLADLELSIAYGSLGAGEAVVGTLIDGAVDFAALPDQVPAGGEVSMPAGIGLALLFAGGMALSFATSRRAR